MSRSVAERRWSATKVERAVVRDCPFPLLEDKKPRTPGLWLQNALEPVYKVAAGLLACRRGRHLAARKNRLCVGEALISPGFFWLRGFFRRAGRRRAAAALWRAAQAESPALRQPRWLTLQFVESRSGAVMFRQAVAVAGPFGCRCLSSLSCISVSTPRSSNRTGGFPASGFPSSFVFKRSQTECAGISWSPYLAKSSLLSQRSYFPERLPCLRHNHWRSRWATK